jgi:hypothetical protein
MANCQLSLPSRSEMTLSKDMRWDGVSGVRQLFYIWIEVKKLEVKKMEQLSIFGLPNDYLITGR